MPGTPATTTRLAIPRVANTDTFDMARDINGVADQVDALAGRFESGLLSARPSTGAGIANRYYFATDNGRLYRDAGGASPTWSEVTPQAHAASHQDGGADALTVREAMMATGNVGLAKGAFRAYRAAAVSLASAGQLIFDTDSGANGFDVSNWYDTSTGRFTPQVAGYYALSWLVAGNTALTADVWWLAQLRKNGAAVADGSLSMQRGTAGAVRSAGSDRQLANGSTDFFDIAVQHNQGASTAITAGANTAYFSGQLIGRS